MDNPWRPGTYVPSSACEVAPYVNLDPDRLSIETKELIKFTGDIRASPYDPELWLYRGRCLRLLGYPELSVGDIYKARLLVEAALGKESMLRDLVTLNFGTKLVSDPVYEQLGSSYSWPGPVKARIVHILEQIELQIWTELMEGLIASNACNDYLQIARQAVIKFPSDEVFPSELANAVSWFKQREDILQEQVDAGEMTEETMQSTLENGGVFPTAYPWMLKTLASRGDQCFEDMKEEFKQESSNCTVAQSAIRNVLSKESLALQTDVFGVIAVKDIKLKETVLKDKTITGVVSGIDRCPACCGPLPNQEITGDCCKVLYCSETCRETALQKFHSALCGKDFNCIYEATETAISNTDFSIDALLLLRVLALSVHENAPHPLQTSILQRLTPAYDTNNLIIFNFPDHIITPIRILQEVGIDIFANPAYDTWVLHTIRCRLQNNKHGQTLDGLYGTAVNPLYSMFNHNCAPNVDWEQIGSTSTLRIFAERDIAKGEELFISYIKPLNMELAERQAALSPWLGMDCTCARCKSERNSE